MADYKTMYYEQAGKVADAMEMLEKAMLDGELHYMLSGDIPPSKPLYKNERGYTENKSEETN